MPGPFAGRPDFKMQNTPIMKRALPPSFRNLLAGITAGCLGLNALPTAADNEAATLEIDFHRDVQPILEQHCVSCHQPDDDQGGLKMHTRAAMIEGGEYARALVPGDLEKSEMIVRITLPHDDLDIMPPRGPKLDEQQVAILSAWVEQGAPMPEDLVLREVTEEDLRRMAEVEEKKSRIRQLQVFPQHVRLLTKRDFQQVVVMATLDDDTTLDVTRFADFQFADDGIAALDEATVKPVGDGSTQLKVAFAGHELQAAVDVERATEDRPISYYLDVMPVFMRENCNSGGCHGAARGQDMFMLSLFGYDPEGDHHRLTREMAGRRINLAMPERSLLIEKSIEAVPHSGGKLFDENSHAYATLVEWISEGAPNDTENHIPVERIEIMPDQMVLEGKGASQQITVRAHYKDGTDRDITHLAVMSSTNDTSATVDDKGLVTADSRGEAFILARFEFHTIAAQVLVIPDELDYQRPELVETNYIDELVNAKLHRLRMLPSEQCSDEEFVRRVHIDILGILPEPETVVAFVDSDNPDKRAELIDELLERPEFSELWVMKWAELLQIHSRDNDRRYYDGTLRYHNWLRDQFEQNRPINLIVRDLLAAEGTTYENPPTLYYEMERDNLLIAENVAQVFMGMRIQCAQCHNHPFDRWTMDDYYGFAAFFAQIGRKETDDPRNRVIFNRGGGGVRHFLTNQDVAPRFLGAEEAEIEAGQDRRAVLAEWLTSPENEFFARNIANIVWAHYLGVGIIEPVDDVRISNPPSNPELLDALAERLVSYDFDLRQLVRDITNSQTYQRSTRANETNAEDDRNFAKASIRRMRAEVLLDAIAQVTNTTLKFPGMPDGARAVQIADGNVSNFFLNTFGRSSRESVCSCEVEVEPNLAQALHLLNGDTVHTRVRQGALVPQLIEQGLDDEAIVADLFLRAYGRKPNQTEVDALMIHIESIDESEQRRDVLEDVFWALLNSKEFMFNH